MPHPFDSQTAAEALLGSTAWNLPGATDAFVMGNRALRAGFLGSARQIFQVLASREPDHPELLMALAETELAAGDPQAALAMLRELSAELSGTPRAQVLRADCALREGRISEALRHGFVGFESAPTDPFCRFLSARFHWLGGQEYEAELAFLSLAGDPFTGDRACAWAVFCGWHQGQKAEISDLAANLRRDDAVCEGLREFGARFLGIPWEPNHLVEPSARRRNAMDWGILHRRGSSLRLSSTAGSFDPKLS